MLVLFFIFHIQGQACACLKISVRTGCIPFMKHSTAMTIRISPISLIITLFPVSPRIFKSRVDTQRIMKERRQTRAITQTSAILKICSGASSISVMPLEITPGPHSIGTARGVTVMFLEYSFFSFSFSFTWVKCACSMSSRNPETIGRDPEKMEQEPAAQGEKYQYDEREGAGF